MNMNINMNVNTNNNVLSQLSCLAVMFWPTCPLDPVHADLSVRPDQTDLYGRPVLDTLSWLSGYGCPDIVVLHWLSFRSCTVRAVIFWRSCPLSSVLAVLSWLSSHAVLSCRVLSRHPISVYCLCILSRRPFPDVLSPCTFPAILSRLSALFSCPDCPVPAEFLKINH